MPGSRRLARCVLIYSLGLRAHHGSTWARCQSDDGRTVRELNGNGAGGGHSDRFWRIHRSTIVNVDRIREMQPLFHGDYLILLRDGTELTLSRTYRRSLPGLFGDDF